MATSAPAPNVHITTTAESEPETPSFLPTTPTPIHLLNPGINLSYIYSTPPSLTPFQNAGLTHHTAIVSAGPPYKFFPVEGASAIGHLSFSPNPAQEDGFWHRTQAVDYIVVLEGEL